MNFSLEKQIALGFGVVLTLLSLICGFSYISINQFIKTSKQTAQTQKVLLQLEQILSEMKDVETGQRGFVITGKGEFLEPYYLATSRISPSLLQLHQLLSSSPEQRGRLNQLKPLVEEKLRLSKEYINLRKQNSFNVAQDKIAHGQGKLVMDRIRQVIAAMETFEDSQLQQQQQETDATAQTTISIITLGLVLAIALVPLTVLTINRDVTKRKKAEHILQERDIALNQANEQLKNWVSELEERNHEIALLKQMNDLFQACLSLEEACIVVAEFMPQLFPNQAGGIFLTNASRNFVETLTTWGDSLKSEQLFDPTDCLSLRQGQALLARSTQQGLVCNHLQQPHPPEYSCIPMQAQGETLGILHLQAMSHQSLSPIKQRLAETVAKQISLALANLRLRDTLQNQSIRDPLTGLFNRRYLEESLSRELRRADRMNHSLSIIMIDVDHFKRFNDTYGHEAGDTVLHTLGNFLRSFVRDSDIACRYGGEELTLLLPEASLGDAQRRAEQIRQEVKRLTVQHQQQLLEAITISLGVACFPEHGRTGEALLRLADAALYQAKNEGRDRVIVAQIPLSNLSAIPPEGMLP